MLLQVMNENTNNMPGPSRRNIFDTMEINPYESENDESDDPSDDGSEGYQPTREESQSTSSDGSTSRDEDDAEDEPGVSIDVAAADQESGDLSCSHHEFTAKDGSKWTSAEPSSGKTPIHNVFRGQQRVCASVDSPVEAFELFLSDEIISIIVTCTNVEGEIVHKDRRGGWKPTDALEIKALLAALLAAGSLKQNMVDAKVLFNDVWGNPFLRSLFSLERFVILMSCLRFDKKDTRSERKKKDPLAPIRDVWDRFERSLRRHYSPDSFLTIDEQLVPFRGRCKFRMYIPSKPDKYGLKIYWICEASTGYPLKGLPYLGKLGRQAETGRSANVVMKLAEPFFRTGRNITYDNFFTDLKLSEVLIKNGLSSVGTVKKNKRFIPDHLRHENLKKDELFSSRFAFQPKASLVTYKSKNNKCVTLLSTMHVDQSISGEKKKPDHVTFYNSTKNGVDGMDKMLHDYSCKRKSKRWPMVYFSNILDIACLAAFLVFKTIKPEHPLSGKNARAEFIRNVSSGLAEGHLVRRSNIPTLSHFLKETIALSLETLGAKKAPPKRSSLSSPSGKGLTPSKTPKKSAGTVPASSEANATGRKKQQRCSLCPWKKDKKVSAQCDKCKCYICPEHKRQICQECL